MNHLNSLKIDQIMAKENQRKRADIQTEGGEYRMNMKIKNELLFFFLTTKRSIH